MPYSVRSDLALERKELLRDECTGVSSEENHFGDIKITRITVENDEGSRRIGKPCGTYTTIELPCISQQSENDEDARTALSVELTRLLPKDGPVLVAGLGNSDITPDALGPKTIEKILATRHISGELSRSIGLGELRPVAAVSPGVLGKTGIETAEILSGIVGRVCPSAVIVIDALASRRLERLGKTVQISNTGIAPGSGVGNRRSEISAASLGVPVISMGVPTVVDALTLAHDILLDDDDKDDKSEKSGAKVFPSAAEMMVTPREIDTVISGAAQLMALGINCTLHPHLTPEELLLLT